MKALLLIRCSVGLIFLSEGIQKFIFPDSLGAGRFLRIGIPFPEFMARVVGSYEIACGMLVLLGFIIRFAVIPLIVIIVVAIITTKIPILIESGFFEMAHEARTDFSMLLSLIFLFIVGAGQYSLDTYLLNRKKPEAFRGDE